MGKKIAYYIGPCSYPLSGDLGMPHLHFVDYTMTITQTTMPAASHARLLEKSGTIGNYVFVHVIDRQ